jgi:hypothetical protein
VRMTEQYYQDTRFPDQVPQPKRNQ